MKRFLLPIFAVLFAANVSAQSVQVFYEDFTGIQGTYFDEELYPKGWRTYFGGMMNWRIGPGASYAGCVAPELMFVYQPTFFGETYLALPPLDLTPYERVVISLTQNYNNGLAVTLPELSIASTDKELGDDWVLSCKNVPYTQGLAETIQVELSPKHVGMADIRIAICLSIFDSGFTAWSFDNIEVTGYLPDGVSESASHFNVYPNPASDVLNIDCEGATTARIYNILGVLVRESEIDNGSIAISDLSEGVYFLKTDDGRGNQRTARFIVRR